MRTKEKPILFSGPMVRAILEGRKTQTRRVVKPQLAFGERFVFEKHPFAPSAMKGTPAEGLGLGPERSVWLAEDAFSNIVGILGDCPYGQPSDRLWVRETWHKNDAAPGRPGDGSLVYAADDCKGCQPNSGKWRPSIHMPRWASRLTLEVTGVRVERLQDISEEDAWSEGLGATEFPDPYRTSNSINTPGRAGFSQLWDSINGDKHPWKSNPWVWVVEFRPLRAEGSRPVHEARP